MAENSAIIAALNGPNPPARSQLQQWAKQFGVKANLASDAIVTQLKAKLSAAPASTGDEAVGSKRKADIPTSAAVPAASDSSEESAPPAKKQKGKAKGKSKSSKQEADAEDSDMPQVAAESEVKEPASSSSAPPPARAPAAPKPAGPVFAGMSFCLTGDFSTGKTGLEGLIERNGGKITSSVTKSLSYLVCGTPAAGPFGGKSGPGSSKCKEARKMKKPVVNEQFILDKINEAKASSKANESKAHPAFESINSILPTVISEMVVQYLLPDHPILDLWEKITALMTPQERADLPEPATEEELDEVEKDMKIGIPEDVRLVLRYGANGFGDINLPSTGDMLEQFNYNPMLPDMLRGLSWLPMGLIDCDFCWRAMDIRSGQLLYLDFECARYCIEATSFESVLENYLTALRKREDRRLAGAVVAAGRRQDSQFEEDVKCGHKDIPLRLDYALWNKFNFWLRRYMGGGEF